MYDEQIREKLKSKGYQILDGNYQILHDYESPAGMHYKKGDIAYLGLIVKDNLVVADIRNNEGLIVLPYYNEIETEQAKTLREMLEKEGIPFRNTSYKDKD